jgi:hypothetical protein
LRQDTKNELKVKIVKKKMMKSMSKYNNGTKAKTTQKTRSVSHCGLAIYIKKYLKAKEEL